MTDNPYDVVVSQFSEEKLRSSMGQAVDRQPESEALVQGLARKYNLPAEVVRLQKPEIERRAKLDGLDYKTIVDNFAATTNFLSDPNNASLAHDDVENLMRQEALFGVLTVPKGPKPSVGATLYGLGHGFVTGLELTRQGIRQQGADLLGFTDMSADAQRKAEQARFRQELVDPEFSSSTAQGLYGGGRSLIQMIPGIAGSIATKSTVPALAAAGIQTEADAYTKYRSRGASPLLAFTGAAGEGAVEVATEMLPMGTLVEKFGKTGATKFLTEFLGKELVGEEAATLAQDAIDTAVANPNKTWADYINERPNAAYQTALGTLVASGAITGASHGLYHLSGEKAKAEEAQRQADALKQLNDLAAASKLRERDPEAFKTFIDKATESGAVQDVYVNPKDLAQSGIDIIQLAGASPSVADQLQQAIDTGADIKIPLSEYATNIAGTDFGTALIDHIKTDPNGMTRAQAEEFYQQEGTKFQAEVEKVLEEKKGDQAFKTSMEVVHKDVMEQLTKANRFTADVNKPYADLVANFYAVQAARVGITPEEMYKRYPIKIQAESVAGPALDQADRPEDVFNIPGVDTYVEESASSIHLSRIEVDHDKQNKGLGTTVMRNITAYADQTQKPITLKVTEDLGSSAPRLFDFYKRFGFKTQGDGETMVRTPRAKKELNQSAPQPQRNSIGLYSAVEKNVLDMNLPGWKPSKKPLLDDKDRARLEELREKVKGTNDPDYAELLDLVALERKEKGVAKGKEVWEKISKLPVKKEELEWLGLEEYLNNSTQEDFTREEVIDFIRENGVEIEEVVADQEQTEQEFDWSRPETVDDPDYVNRRADDIESEITSGGDYETEYDQVVSDLMDDEERYIDENYQGDPEDGAAKIAWFEQNFSDTIKTKVREKAEEIAQREYDDNPVLRWHDRGGTDYEITGNDDVGYAINGDWGIGIYSFNEAEIRAYEMAREDGSLSSGDDPYVAKWGDYVTPGRSRSYRERKFKLPGISANFYKATHFEDENIVAFTRETDRTLPGYAPEGYNVGKEIADIPLPDSFQPDGEYGENTLKKLEQEGRDAVIESYRMAGLEPEDAVLNDYSAWRPQVQRNVQRLVKEAHEKSKEAGGMQGTYQAYTDIQNKYLDMQTVAQEYQQRLYDKSRVEQDILNQNSDKSKLARSPYAPRKTFFVDEFQSDWHQAGRQDGYKTGQDAGELEERAKASLANAGAKYAEMVARYANGPLFDEKTNTGVAAIEFLADLRKGALEHLERQLDIKREGILNKGETFTENNLPYSYKNVKKKIETTKGFDFLKFLATGEFKDDVFRPDMGDGEIELFNDKVVAAALSNFAKNTDNGKEIIDLIKSSEQDAFQANAERYGVDDAPFKEDNWIALGLKRVLVDAVGQGYQRVAWPDSDVLARRWSERYRKLYEMQYDTKMPSVIKRLTGMQPTYIESEPELGNAGYWYVDITPELADKIRNEAFPLYQGDGTKRGAFNPYTSTITLLKAADLSTFLHEAGHFFLETMNKMALDPNAPQEIKDDMQTTLTWLGVKDIAEWNSKDLEQQRQYHEQFARGFEAYLFEGKSPSVEMQGVFQRFRAWLLNVYKSIKSLSVDLSPEIRGVFDRMLATTEQIKQSEAARNYEPLFKTPEEGGMTPEEFKAYHDLGVQATQDAITKLEARSLSNMKWLSNAKGRLLRQLQREAEAKRKAARREVTDEVMAEPINLARTFLKRGILNGEQVDTPHRLDIEAVKQIALDNQSVGDTLDWQSIESKFGAYGILGKDGLHPDVVADMFGFTSGSHLIRELIEAEDPKTKIAGLTDQRMLERYGDLTSDEAIERAAEAAIHNDARSRFVAAEMNALQKATGGRKILAEAAKRYADAMIARLKVRELSPSRYAAAEARAAKAAAEAQKSGDLAAAAVEKRNQLIQNYATRAAVDAAGEIEKALRYFKKFSKDSIRKSIDADYADQIDALLSRFDLSRNITLKAIDQRKSLVDWVAKQQELGLEPEIPLELLNEANRKHYKDMTIEEMRGLVDTVKQIEHLGRLKNRLLTAADARDFKATVAEMVASIEANAGNRTADNRTRPTKADRAVRLYKGFLAQHRKLSSLAREMDGFKDGGKLWDVLIRSMNDAGNKETTMREQATVKLAELVKPLLAGGKMGGKGVYFKSIGRSLNREERIAMALNTGNLGNFQRLLDGEGFTHAQIAPVLDTLTKEDWDFVQSIWDFFESYRPMIAAKERRIYGKEPEWVDPHPVNTKFGTYRGGYYPIKYDPRLSAAAEQHNDAEAAKQMMKGAYTSATTRRSFTKSRVDEVKGRPLLLTMDGLYSGLNEVIHDLSWHEWLIDANRLFRNKAFDAAIRNHYGADVVRQFKDGIRDVAAGGLPSGDALEKVLGNLRAGATVAGLGFNIMNSIINITGLTQSIVRIGPKWVAIGAGEWARSPIGLVTQIHDKSEFMRTRAKTQQREINEIRSMIQDKSQLRQAVDRIMFFPVTMTQMAVDTPTWWGAYQKAIAEGEEETRAVALADQAVIDAQGSGMVKDLSAIQRGGPYKKLFTTFYSFFNTTYNLSVESVKKTDFKDPLDIARLGGDFLMLYSVPALFGTLIKAALGGEDDPEKLAKNLANDQISYLFGAMVGLREAAGVVQALAGTSQATSYNAPAGLRIFQESYKLAQQINQGELDRALVRSAINVGGILLHLPSTQVNRTIDGIAALSEGRTHNPAALIAGAPPKK